MNKKHFILKGQFDQTLLTYFKSQLRDSPPGSTIFVRINSIGGDVHIMNVMIAIVFFLIKRGKFRFVAEIEQIQSAALIFALSMQERRVTHSSKGKIHLPVSAEHSAEVMQNKRKQAARYIEGRTSGCLNQNEIEALDGFTLSASELINYGIATQMVERFQPHA